MKKWMQRFLKDEAGLELSEYAVMAALIIIAIFGAIAALRGQIVAAFEALSTTIADGAAAG